MREPPKLYEPSVRHGRLTDVLYADETGRDGFVSEDAASLRLELDGIAGGRHQGWSRAADARVPYLKRGTTIRNQRHVSIVSREDLAEIARRLDVAYVDPRWIGANLVVEGIPALSFLPRGTRLFLDGGAILIVEDQNTPCAIAGGMVALATGRDERTRLAFAREAKGLRGVVATVEHPGEVRAATAIEARIPVQWIYS
jgi:hypothetical protein